jgi:hypothetical protein
MARTHAAAPNGGWPPQRTPGSSGQAQPGAQAAQPAGYPQAGYPEQQAAPYDPQAAYHYPQQPAAAAPPGARQGLSSLEPVSQPNPDYAAYPATQPPYGQARQGYPPQRGYGQGPLAAPGYNPWPAPGPAQDPRGYDLGSYMPAGTSPGHHVDPLQQQADWAVPAGGGYGDPAQDAAYQGGQMGYDQPHAGALEQTYAQEESGDYDVDEPRRGSWVLRIAGAIVVAVGLGYGLAQGYKLVSDTAPEGATPVVKGDDSPAKTKPADPGGKQFDHADSKVMGRLGEAAPSGEANAGAPESETDGSGARKVQTLVVGRDGSIAPPAAPAEPTSTATTVAVPGLTVVDGLGGRYPDALGGPPAPAPAESAKPPVAARQPIVVKPPATSEPKPEVVAKASPAPAEPAGEPAGVAAPAPPQKAEEPKKPSEGPSAAASPPAAASSTNGYVVVLASVPASEQSRLAALKQFADMQQQYGTVLQNKTPDVQEANLGEKGVYHRLLVGPPGSRAQASALCSELKAAGYKDCWVMAY